MLCPSCNRVVNGSKCLCGWRSSIVEAARPTTEVVLSGPYITKAEFGLPLYTAIQCYAEKQAVQRQQQAVQNNDTLPVAIQQRRLTDLAAQLDTLTRQIMACMPHILPGDIQRLLRTYDRHDIEVTA